MTSVHLIHDDCKAAMRRLTEQGRRVHSVVTDPPYGLTSVVKRFGKGSPNGFGKDGRFQRHAAGFMNQIWDGTGIENDPEMWRLCFELILPGGYLVAFSSSRTYDLMTSAIREAGFIIHPMIGWLNGQSFPKAHAADRAIDQELGVEGSPEGAEWEGYAYGTQARKPVLEPICVAQRPFAEKNGARNILKYGVGAVNIDGCRVPTADNLNGGAYAQDGSERDDAWGVHNGYRRNQGLSYEQPVGRWPANLIHDGSPEVLRLFPYSRGQQGDVRGNEPSGVTNGIYGKFLGRVASTRRHDEGSAARFFESYPFDDAPVFYHPKATAADRIYRCPACGERFAGKPRCGCGAGSETHPTVKPIGLIRSLVRHVTPPGGTVLDPFAGSGTTGAAALHEGVSAILIERETNFVADIEHRFGMELTRAGEMYLNAIAAR